MKRAAYIILCLLLAAACHREEMPQTARTKGLIRELISELDSTDVIAARKEKKIEGVKSRLPGRTDEERYAIYYKIAEEYSKYVLDSSIVYLQKAIRLAREKDWELPRINAEITLASILSPGGFYSEAHETIASVPRDAVSGDLLVQYYNAWAMFYHELSSAPNEPEAYQKRYRESYNVYRDSLLAVADTLSMLYLHNMERKEARLGHIDEARRYNDIRLSILKDPKSADYATCLYDRFMIAYYYERKLTGEAVDDLLESAIIEVGNSNHDIASLLRVEALLNNIDEVKAAKKVSDYYYASLRQFGSRKRIFTGGEQALQILDLNNRLLQKRNHELLITLFLITLLMVALLLALVVINSERVKITRLKDDLQRSGKISKGYVGAVFQLYSSYIKRLDVFRTKIHSTLKRGQVEQALDLTSPSGDIASEERKELFRNFDSAFVDIFPNFIETVNACLKPGEKIEPKKTEILNNELRLLALIKLGIEDSTEMADMLHCSVKTVYNLRSILKARLAIPEEAFNKIVSEL